MEKEVTIQCRQVDLDLVKKSVEEAQEIYKQALGQEVNVTIDASYLPAERYSLADFSIDSAGGVVASAKEGNIKVSNTLESRLLLLQESVSGAGCSLCRCCQRFVSCSLDILPAESFSTSAPQKLNPCRLLLRSTNTSKK